jgi:hypothetical protein
MRPEERPGKPSSRLCVSETTASTPQRPLPSPRAAPGKQVPTFGMVFMIELRLSRGR